MAVSRSAVKATTAGARQGNTLSTFVWEGKDKRGIVLKGEEQARSVNLLRAELRKRGISPGVVKIKPKPLFGASGKPIKPKDIAVFSRQLATMMKSGVPLVQGLEIIGNGQKNPRMQQMVETIRVDIENGSSVHEALSKHPVQFDELFRNLVKAGESAGVLETVLATVANYKEKTESLKGKIKKALFYPIAVIAVAIVVSAILLIFVIPTFEEVFQGFGADLPAFTKMVVAISRFTVSWWWAILGVILVGLFGGMYIYRRSTAIQHGLDRLILRLPVIGQIMHNSAIARFARTTAVSFRAGVPLVEALDSVAGATGNTVYEKAVHRIRDDVAVGYPVNMAMKQVNLFPHMVVQMTAIGEEAGALDEMLMKVAEFYEEEVDNAVDALASLLEPFIIVFIGAIVGAMVVAMYLPIFKIAATI
ncbi:MAG: type II secretion system F family protein [Pseudoxanthomonas suwonensis]|nr:type II secretion system F family protein [Pseudoxanthomonas suwonensis]